jgi:hypothetical protein
MDAAALGAAISSAAGCAAGSGSSAVRKTNYFFVRLCFSTMKNDTWWWQKYSL